MDTLLISVLVINSIKLTAPHSVVYSIVTFSCHCLVSDAMGQGGPSAQTLSFFNLQHHKTPHVITLLVVPQVRVSHLHASPNP